MVAGRVGGVARVVKRPLAGNFQKRVNLLVYKDQSECYHNLEHDAPTIVAFDNNREI